MLKKDDEHTCVRKVTAEWYILEMSVALFALRVTGIVVRAAKGVERGVSAPDSVDQRRRRTKIGVRGGAARRESSHCQCARACTLQRLNSSD
jgi:hypothetical protein